MSSLPIATFRGAQDTGVYESQRPLYFSRITRLPAPQEGDMDTQYSILGPQKRFGYTLVSPGISSCCSTYTSDSLSLRDEYAEGQAYRVSLSENLDGHMEAPLVDQPDTFWLTVASALFLVAPDRILPSPASESSYLVARPAYGHSATKQS